MKNPKNHEKSPNKRHENFFFKKPFTQEVKKMSSWTLQGRSERHLLRKTIITFSIPGIVCHSSAFQEPREPGRFKTKKGFWKNFLTCLKPDTSSEKVFFAWKNSGPIPWKNAQQITDKPLRVRQAVLSEKSVVQKDAVWSGLALTVWHLSSKLFGHTGKNNKIIWNLISIEK